MIWSVHWELAFFQNLETTYIWHQIDEYSICIRFFWPVLDLFVSTINRVMILLIAHIARYIEQILAITWRSMWACFWRRIKSDWSMRFLSLWMNLLVDFILIMQVLVLMLFQRQDMFFLQICFQSSNKID